MLCRMLRHLAVAAGLMVPLALGAAAEGAPDGGGRIPLHPAHEVQLLLLPQRLATPMAAMTVYDGTEAEVAQLLDQTAQALAQPMAEPAIAEADLLGDWRCRSLQLSPNTGDVYVYRFFECRVSRGEQGQLVFEKLTGSQRRFGLLTWDQHWVFMGGAYVQDDPVIQYSRVMDDDTPRETDSFGLLAPLGQDHLVLAFAEDLPDGLEIYELRR